MSAAEVWCLLAGLAAAASTVLAAVAPRTVDSYTARACTGLLAVAVACLAAALAIAL
jgi:hypothetical protein